MKVVCRVLQVLFFAPESILPHSEDPGHPVGNVDTLYETTVNFFNEQDVRDSQELAGPQVRKTLHAHYIEALWQEYFIVDIDPSDAIAIDHLAVELVHLSVFFIQALLNPMKRLCQPLQVHVPSLPVCASLQSLKGFVRQGPTKAQHPM